MTSIDHTPTPLLGDLAAAAGGVSHAPERTATPPSGDRTPVPWTEFDGGLWTGGDPVAVVDVGHHLDDLLADLRAGWRGEAACIGSDVNFYPERGESSTEALELCRRCPVRTECLEDSLAGPARLDLGIRGGLSASARTKLRRRRRQHRQ